MDQKVGCYEQNGISTKFLKFSFLCDVTSRKTSKLRSQTHYLLNIGPPKRDYISNLLNIEPLKKKKKNGSRSCQVSLSFLPSNLSNAVPGHDGKRTAFRRSITTIIIQWNLSISTTLYLEFLSISNRDLGPLWDL